MKMFWPLNRKFIQTIVITTFVIINHSQLGYCAVKFVPDDLDIFSRCDDLPSTLGIHDIANLSGLNITLAEDRIYVGGLIEMLWEIDATDRVLLKIELLKYVRGFWQPTFLTFQVYDLCKDMVRPNNYVYNVWTKHIVDEDRGCLYKGKIIRHIPFETEISYKGAVKMSGMHKIRLIVKAFDENSVQKTATVCIDGVGEIVPL